jgi:hypothetical protein
MNLDVVVYETAIKDGEATETLWSMQFRTQLDDRLTDEHVQVWFAPPQVVALRPSELSLMAWASVMSMKPQCL